MSIPSKPETRDRSRKTTLVVGLGNVGKKYERTRHNVGFLVVNELARRHGAIFSEKKKLRALVAEVSTPEGKLVLVKPTTYMNRSGEAVQAVMAWQKPDRIIAIYDDADLPLGEIRVRESGGSAGHNGVKSLIEHLGHAFTRVRVGIGRPENARVALEDWVLQNWSKEEEERLGEIVQQAVEEILNPKL